MFRWKQRGLGLNLPEVEHHQIRLRNDIKNLRHLAKHQHKMLTTLAAFLLPVKVVSVLASRLSGVRGST